MSQLGNYKTNCIMYINILLNGELAKHSVMIPSFTMFASFCTSYALVFDGDQVKILPGSNLQKSEKGYTQPVQHIVWSHLKII